MSADQPPPYHPYFPEGPSVPGFPPALSSQPTAFPGTSFQTFPQTYTGGGDHSYYHGTPGTTGAFTSQPGYQGYQSGAQGVPQHWDGSKPHGEPPKQRVFMVDQQNRGAGLKDSCLAACSAVLCCCCLWDMLTR
ncbi:cysteine-rich and transmembrane domain-containing protein 1-like [Mastacembelus armatus]|uniref:cysteine-rich and transmembrane domain-containing protein 1-like n=1 Tax=Mastacembelus armatus TaxID=205130 RepID=UPI001436C06B|nr:cysteine-rich and transmembrane domain-containing protein 1-like [Mastacembelus armatus]